MSRYRQRIGLIVISLLSAGSCLLTAPIAAHALTACETNPPPGGAVYDWYGINIPDTGTTDFTVTDYTSLAFEVPGSIYACTTGAKITLNVGGNGRAGGSESKEIAISACPGDFTVPMGCFATITNNSTSFTDLSCPNLALDTLSGATPHKVYVNIRPTSGGMATMASASISVSKNGCSNAADRILYDGSQLNIPTVFGNAASADASKIVAIRFSPFTSSTPPTSSCPAGSYYQLRLERAFASMTTAYSPMTAVLSLTPFDVTGGGTSSECKVTVPMTEEFKTITLLPPTNMTTSLCATFFDSYLGTSYVKCNNPPTVATVNSATGSTNLSGFCNINTAFYQDSYGNYSTPNLYLNVVSAGSKPSSVKVTGQCVTAAALAAAALPPPLTTVFGLPPGCAPDTVPISDVNGLGDGSTVNKTGMLSASHKSMAFTSPGAPHNCGVRFSFERDMASYTGPPTDKPMHEVTISTCPNVFTVPAGKELCHFYMGNPQDLVLNNSTAIGGCEYPAGTTLFVNVRPFPNTMGGDAALKFTSKWLDGTCGPRPVTVAPVYPYMPAKAVPVAAVTIPGCDADILDGMRSAGQATSGYLDTLMGAVLKPPQSAMSFNCMRDLFNIWDTDLVGAVAGYVAGYFSFLSMPGITLTESSLYKPIMSAINSMLSSSFNSLVCTGLWNNVAAAMTPVSILANGSFSMGSVPSVTMSGGTITIP